MNLPGQLARQVSELNAKVRRLEIELDKLKQPKKEEPEDKEMKLAFHYIGQDARGRHHVSLITKKGEGEALFLHYIFDERFTKASRVDHYVIGVCPERGQIPRPTKLETTIAYDYVSRFFSPFTPYLGIPLIIGDTSYFFQEGAWETFKGDNLFCVSPEVS